MFFILLTFGLGLGLELGQGIRHFGFSTILPSVLWLTFSSRRATCDVLSLPCGAVISNYLLGVIGHLQKKLPKTFHSGRTSG